MEENGICETLKAAGYQNLETVERATGIDLQRRGETLSLEEFAALASRLEWEEAVRIKGLRR